MEPEGQRERLMLMGRLAAAFPRDRVRDATVTLYATKLSRIDLETLADSVEVLIEGAHAFPTIAEIRADCAARRRRYEALPESTGEPTQMPEEVRSMVTKLADKMDLDKAIDE